MTSSLYPARRGIDASEIAPGLWMGSAPPHGRTLFRAGFHVLTLTAIEHQPSAEYFPNVIVARVGLIDDGSPLTTSQWEQALSLSGHLAREARHGRCVLVTCAQGRNRSGLVTALTLARMTGCDGRAATRAVQERRKSPYGPALTNSEYVKALRGVPAAEHRGPVTSSLARAAGF
jgi:hypothetical protein